MCDRTNTGTNNIRSVINFWVTTQFHWSRVWCTNTNRLHLFTCKYCYGTNN